MLGITGGTGFIGQALVARLRERGVAYRIFEGDLSDRESLMTCLAGCDQVIHLAGVFSSDFDQLIAVNLIGTRNVVEVCKQLRIPKIIFSSSGAVYGEPAHGTLSSEDDSLQPNTLYGLSKWYAEEYLRFSGIVHIILRFPNVYGPKNRKGVIFNFIRDIEEKKKVSIFGSGEQKRNFLFVDDAVTAIVKAVDCDQTITLNIADAEIYSLKEIAALFKEKLHLDFTVDYRPEDVSNTLQILSEDIQKAKMLLRWEPTTPIVAGLKETLHEYTEYEA